MRAKLPSLRPNWSPDVHSRLAEYIGPIFLVSSAMPATASCSASSEASSTCTLAVRLVSFGLQRLADLWARRLEQLDEGDPELREYGWWFAPRRLDPRAEHWSYSS